VGSAPAGRRRLAGYRLPATNALADESEVIGALRRLRELGIRIALPGRRRQDRPHVYAQDIVAIQPPSKSSAR
jgi:hypothetical protein